MAMFEFEPGRMYEVEGDLLGELVAFYLRHNTDPHLEDLEHLRRDVNGRQQFWGRQHSLAADGKRA